MEEYEVAGDISDELRQLRRKLRDCRKALKAAQEERDALCNALDMGILPKTWEPNPDIERMYGPAHAWSFPLSTYFNDLLRRGEPLTPDVRNRVGLIFRSVLVRILAKHRYGLDLPHEERSAVVTEESMVRAITLDYPACIVCGEKRITHDCHIVPRTEGGPRHPDNMLPLCPLHHHLFDHHRLLPEEWAVIDRALDGKMETARIYARAVRLPQMQAFWNQQHDGDCALRSKDQAHNEAEEGSVPRQGGSELSEG